VVAHESPEPAVIDRLDRCIGRNLRRYQLIELRLKTLLPLLRGTWEVSQDGIDAWAAERDAVHQHTLGGLASRLKEKFGGEAQQVERHVRAIDDIVRRRNDLMHHLFDRLSWTAADIEEACARLDREHEEAAPLAQWVRDLLQAQGRSMLDALEFLERSYRGTSGSRECLVSDGQANLVWRVREVMERHRGAPDGWLSLASLGEALHAASVQPGPKLKAWLLAHPEDFEIEQVDGQWRCRPQPPGTLILAASADFPHRDEPPCPT
jgi:hypothetical protein